MSLTSGTRLGAYEIGAMLGAGGMGEVYRARDTTLQRDVAIKVLPGAFVADPDRFRRFKREAQVLASLNHSGIAQIYGFEDSDRGHAIVLELVDGKTLARRIEEGPIPIAEALAIARQIADALAAAHEAGVVHRDLKPANIAQTHAGRIKVLDFGLAKSILSQPSDVAMATVTSPETMAGSVLGTAAYMSPEQARGKPIDKRTDIWAFGCVVFELLTGRRAFAGETISDTVAAVLEREPDWRLLPAGTPARIAWLLRRCLEKDRDKRLHDIADARIEIDEALSPRPDAAPALADRGALQTNQRLLWAGGAAVLSLVLLAWYAGRFGAGPPGESAARVLNAAIVLPDGLRLAAINAAGRFAISPDGRLFALVATDAAGKTMVWVRPLESRGAQPLEGTEGASFPFWSPDSRSIGFFAQGKLKKIDASGGDAVTLCDSSAGSSGTWNSGGAILFSARGDSPIFRVAASGGTPVQVTTIDTANGDVQHSYPFFLPDGRHFLYFGVGSKAGGMTDARGIYVASIDSAQPGTLLVAGGSNGKYADGRLVFVRDGILLAQPFDPVRLVLSGQAGRIVEQVQIAGASTTGVPGSFSVSQTGLLVYQTGSVVRSQLTWFDRRGTSSGTLGEPDDYADVALSPDGSRVAVSVLDPALGSRDLWMLDVVRGLRERFTFDPGDDFGPNWSRPAADRIVFSSRRSGSVHLYEKGASGGGSEQVLLADPFGKYNPRVLRGRPLRGLRRRRRHHQSQRRLHPAALRRSQSGAVPQHAVHRDASPDVARRPMARLLVE